jgi:hypothetical protein
MRYRKKPSADEDVPVQCVSMRTFDPRRYSPSVHRLSVCRDVGAMPVRTVHAADAPRKQSVAYLSSGSWTC